MYIDSWHNRYTRYLAGVVVCLAMFIAACTPSPPLESHPLELEPSAREMIVVGVEQRSAWRMPSARYEYAIDVASPYQIFRVGILPTNENSPVTFTLVRDGESLVLETPSDVHGWSDLRISLEQSSKQYTIAIDCEDEFWLSHYEHVVPSVTKPNVLLFVVDTLRSDRLSCYGYALNTSPYLDALAGEGVLFSNAVSQSSWTRPAIASILTSTYPGVHGAEDRPDIVRAGLPSLSTTLRENGYTTIGIINNPNLQTRWGFGSDFDRYIDHSSRDVIDRNNQDRLVIDTAMAALDDVGDRNWMIYTHIIAPHGPYFPPPPFDEKFPPVLDGLDSGAQKAEVMRSGYDGDIAFADALFGQLLDDLKARGIYDNTIVVFVSDHGEQFLEHGAIGHGFSLFDEELMVPLVMKLPGIQNTPRVIENIVETIDIAPTILQSIGVKPNPRFQGRSLSGIINGEDDPHRLGYARLRLAQVDMHTVRSDRYKYIFDVTTKQQTLFDLVADPNEQNPRSAIPPEAAALVEYARDRTTADAVGFHFLLIDIEASNRPVEATVHVSGMGEHDFRHPGGDIVTERNGDTISFQGRMEYADDDRQLFELWTREVRLNNFVHIHAEAHIDGQVGITFAHRAQPPSPPATQGGQSGMSFPLDGTPIPLTAFIAGPDRYAMTTLPEQFAIYAWYVPEAESIADSELPPEVLESLEALGYLRE
jgi:arylsulfatase A-like enzyme